MTKKKNFDQDGFVHLPCFLTNLQLVELQKAVERYILEIVPQLNQSEVFFDNPEKPETLKQLQRMEQDPFFANYSRHSHWNKTASEFLGEPVEVLGVEYFNKPPKTKHKTPPHQDNHYFCLAPPQVLTIWVALDYIDDENGCIHYVRGSHTLPVRQHRLSSTLGFSQCIPDYSQSDMDSESKFTCQPGDAVIHHGNTIHRAGPNLTKNRQRRALAMVFRGKSASRDYQRFNTYLESSNQQQASFGIESK
ncbi:MAG: phytanoyl-CoA dioxygenase family protein [Candidatus Marinimicrobia bacterium]|nr:phytanoyl-CoA dioxygenase family protein [Candidatus Neomarinimicrobiota bacterium]